MRSVGASPFAPCAKVQRSAARRASYQLFAREVAPRFTGELDQLLASQRRAVVAREGGYARRIAAQEKAYAKLTDRPGAGE